MAYQRKTRDVWVILGDYGYGYEVVFATTIYREARDILRTYRLEQPNATLKLRKYREKIEQ